MKAPAAARTPGATRAGPGEYLFDLAKVNHILGGPDYSTANGACVEGDRMIVGADAHAGRHRRGSRIRIRTSSGSTSCEGTFQATVGGKDVTAKAGSVLYIPSNAVHSGKATPDADVVFFTVKDASHSLHGIKAA